jgi:hypothetical protein
MLVASALGADMAADQERADQRQQADGQIEGDPWCITAVGPSPPKSR